MGPKRTLATTRRIQNLPLPSNPSPTFYTPCKMDKPFNREKILRKIKIEEPIQLRIA
jgi:hypothetical protein